jgi:hypothetical protein
MQSGLMQKHTCNHEQNTCNQDLCKNIHATMNKTHAIRTTQKHTHNHQQNRCNQDSCKIIHATTNKTNAIRIMQRHTQPSTKHMQSGPFKSIHATVNKNTCNQDLCKNMNTHKQDYGRQAVFCKLAVLKTVKKKVQYLSSACTKH